MYMKQMTYVTTWSELADTLESAPEGSTLVMPRSPMFALHPPPILQSLLSTTFDTMYQSDDAIVYVGYRPANSFSVVLMVTYLRNYQDELRHTTLDSANEEVNELHTLPAP